MKRKRNPEIVETIQIAKKKNMLELAKELSRPTRQYSRVNLNELNNFDGEVIVVGKVLGSGDCSKKIKIVALGFSESAKAKLKKSGCEIKKIRQFIEGKKDLEGVKII